MIAQWDAKKTSKSRSRLCFLPWLVQARCKGDKHSQVVRRLHAICLTFFFFAALAQTLLCWPKPAGRPKKTYKSMCALFCRGSWPTAGPLQAHLARSNICEHLSSQEEMPRQTCATHPCSNLDTQGNVRHRTCSIEVNFMI